MIDKMKQFKKIYSCDNCAEKRNFIRLENKFIDSVWDCNIEYIYCYSCDRESELS